MMAKKAKKARLVECRSTTAGWASRHPSSPRNFIKRGEVVTWAQKLKDGSTTEYEPLPTWLVPVKEQVPEEVAEEEPKTLSELQHSTGGRARRPQGA